MKTFYETSRNKNADYHKCLKSEYLFIRILLDNNDTEIVKIPQLEIDIFSSIADGDQALFSHMVDRYLLDLYQCDDCIKDWVAALSDNTPQVNIIKKQKSYDFDFDYV